MAHLDSWLTISMAADELNVTRQRMHVLVKTYGIQTQSIDGRVKLVNRRELDKIPKQRPPGPIARRKKTEKS